MTNKEMIRRLDEMIDAAQNGAFRERKNGNDRQANGYSEFYRDLNAARDTLIFKVPED